jgi:hypothetical protein
MSGRLEDPSTDVRCDPRRRNSPDAAEAVTIRVLLEPRDKQRCAPPFPLANFKVEGELFVVLGDGQRETPCVRIRHPLRVHFRFLRTQPAVFRIVQA